MTDPLAVEDLVRASGQLDLAAVTHRFAEELDADGAVVLVVDPATRQLGVAASYPVAGEDGQAVRIPVGYGVTGLVALNGRPITMAEDSPRNEAHRHLLGLAPGATVSRLCVPARGIEEETLAVVAVHRHLRVPFDESDVALAQRWADLVGLRLQAEALERGRRRQRYERDQLTAHAISAQEAERRRIAGDLHDGVTQVLASLAFHLSAADIGLGALAESDPAAAATLEEVRAARRLAGLAYDETRAAISGLHSLLLDDLGLVAALESLAQSVPQLDVEVHADPTRLLEELPEHGAAVLYRIAQEAVSNVVKHASASRAVLSLRRVGEAVVLGVTDDGAGFDVRRARATASSPEAGEHYGLTSIAERCALVGATLRIESAQDRGTALMVELPLPSVRAGEGRGAGL